MVAPKYHFTIGCNQMFCYRYLCTGRIPQPHPYFNIKWVLKPSLKRNVALTAARSHRCLLTSICACCLQEETRFHRKKCIVLCYEPRLFNSNWIMWVVETFVCGFEELQYLACDVLKHDIPTTCRLYKDCTINSSTTICGQIIPR